MDIGRVDSAPHDFEPALSRHHSEHGDHSDADVVEVTFLVDPVASKVKTIPLRVYLVLNILRHICCIADEEGSLEQAHSLNTEDHKNQHRYKHQVEDAWDGIH